jgi:hypothetical protein
MKYYLIYFLDYKKNDTIIIKDVYMTREDAMSNLERVTIEYIKDLQGKQQVDMCKEHEGKTPDQLLANKSIKEGLYIRKIDDHILLYQKVTMTVSGMLWNYNKLRVQKIGQFYVTEYNFDDILFKCPCQNNKIETNVLTIKQSNTKKYEFMKELQDKFIDGEIKLKHVD